MQETATISSDRQDANGGPREVARRLLMGGQLLEAERTFASLNPATGDVLGYAPDASIDDAEAAVAAARRAFDEGTWSTDTELRVRCLEQLHQALLDHRDELAALTIRAESPQSTRDGA